VILDTNAVSAILSGDPDVVPRLADEDRPLLPVIVIGEYRYGLLRSSSRARLLPAFEALIRESRVLGIDVATAAVYARVRDGLRAAGTPIPENDVWIAALAVQHGEPVLSRDVHLDRVDGVVRHGW
jgi:tRNA(fMet)-specific endonuclease VapC